MSDESWYLDTSALAKWYLNEAGSDEFSAWIQGIDRATISELTETEMRCLLARRRRMRQLDCEMEARIFSTFQNDIAEGHLSRLVMTPDCFGVATRLIDRLPHVPLRTLDALHLAVAQQQGVGGIATADCVFAGAAENLKFKVLRFADCGRAD